jgi:hypothetical protein
MIFILYHTNDTAMCVWGVFFKKKKRNQGNPVESKKQVFIANSIWQQSYFILPFTINLAQSSCQQADGCSHLFHYGSF